MSDRLKSDAVLTRRRLRVDASGLVLTLSGTVGDEDERRRALAIARAEANAHMLVSDELALPSSAPVPPALSRAAQYRFIRNGAPAAPPPPPPPPPPPRPVPPPPRAPGRR